MAPSTPNQIKVVFLGKENSGKTSINERYMFLNFNEKSPYQSTIGAAFSSKKIRLPSSNKLSHTFVTLALWDTAGSERYEAMSRLYYREAFAAIVCFDITSRSSFEKAKFWLNEVSQCEECMLYLCATKKDLQSQRLIPSTLGEELASGFLLLHLTFLLPMGWKASHLYAYVCEDFLLKNLDS